MDDLLSEFLTEASESLSGLDEALLVLERTPGDTATVGRIFRVVHTVKGTCGFLGLGRLEKVAHAAENVLGLLREGAIKVTPSLVTIVLKAVDAMRQILAALATTGEEPHGDDAPVIAALTAICDDCSNVASVQTTSAIEASALVSIDVIEETPLSNSSPIPGGLPTGPTRSTGDGGLSQQTIRVNVSVLESLMTLVSELVLTRNQLLQITRTSKEPPFAVPVQRLSQITSDLQEGIMKTRMQPIGSAWSKLPRLVRDLSRDLGKSIELRMLGAETEVDRQILELIRDPLTHMVRNCADHGLESVVERRAANKPDTGVITLAAFHEGGHITIEIADDGRGLPVEKIRQKVVAKGLATTQEIAAMSDTVVQRYIFHAGFSTAAEVTSVSGRGVGMDVVKTNIEQIGGTVEIAGNQTIGTKFIINIPLTLAIVSALIVESRGERFAIAQSSVAELVHAERANSANTHASQGQSVIENINGTPVLRLRERLLPLVHLSDILQLESPSEYSGKHETYVVVISIGSNVFGIVVDKVFDTEEIVVKPVAPILRDIAFFSGNTVLGDGAVIMILDPNGIAEALKLTSNSATRAPAIVSRSGTDSEAETAILVFHAGSSSPKAVPLSLVARLERISAARVERSSNRLLTQYCGKLMPLVPFSDTFDLASRSEHPVLVFTEGERSVGLLVDEIIDVIHGRLFVEMGASEPGLLGTAIVAGSATDIVDTVFWLAKAGQDWFGSDRRGSHGAGRLLVIEDSAFFRNMLIPALSSGGYHVTAVNNAEEALTLRAADVVFDAIISDIEMPGMDGLSFVRAVRSDGIWSALPIIALSGRANASDIEIGLRAGFSHYMAKFDREALLDRLQRCLQPKLQDAA